MYLINQFEKDLLDNCMTKLKENNASKQNQVILKNTATETEKFEKDSNKEESKTDNASNSSDHDESVIEIDKTIDKKNQ